MRSREKFQFLKTPPVIFGSGTMRGEQSIACQENPQHRQASLTVIRGRADLGVHTFVKHRAVVGRDCGCQLPLLDHQASRRHASIMMLREEHYQIQDLGSTNGTRVGRARISGPHPLRDGDRILIGQTVIRFSLVDGMDVDYESEVATLVGTDPLTGLPSKRRFDEAFEFAVQTALRSNGSLAFLMMDMDGVKQINDTHGHLFGAHVIGEVGRLIATCLDNQGHACRFGGDEFSAFLPGYNLITALELAESIRLAVESARMQKDGIPLRPTISIGVACCPESGQQPLELVSKSDAALYRAKASGRNCVCS